jgi:Uma2 family endonuclease
METERHDRQMTLLRDSLELAWRDRDDFYVGGNMFLYFSVLQAKKNDFRGPDLFVVLGVERRERRSWVVWEEDGRVPDVIIELTSPSTEAEDRGVKMRVYGGVLHVGEYYLFDPFSGVLEGYTLEAASNSYRRMEPDANGWLPCCRLGLRLGVMPSKHGTTQGELLRWIDEHGKPLPTPAEAAEAAEARVAGEARRAEHEARRAEGIEAELEAYRRKFGPLAG